MSVKRPLGVTLLGLFYLLGGAFAIVGSLISVPFQGAGILMGFPTLLLGALYLYIGYMLLKGSKYAYFMTIAMTILGAAVNIGKGIFVSLPVYVVLLLYLLSPGVRRFFLRRETEEVVEGDFEA